MVKRLLAVVLTLSILLLSTCDLFGPLVDMPVKIPDGKVQVFIKVLNADSLARTIFPDIKEDDIAELKLYNYIIEDAADRPANNADTTLAVWDNRTGGSVLLDPGNYDFTLIAFDSEGEPILLGIAEDRDIPLASGNTILIGLYPLNSGEGSIDITFNFPTGSGVNLVKVFEDGADIYSESVTDIIFNYVASDKSKGDYFTVFKFYTVVSDGQGGEIEHLRVTVSELIQVRGNVTSRAEINLTMADINPLNTVERYVTQTGAGTRDGTSWANASGDLQEMIDKVFEAWRLGAKAIVHVGAGEYEPWYVPNSDGTINHTGTTSDSRDSVFLLRRGVELRGGYIAAGEEIGESTRKGYFNSNGEPINDNRRATLSGNDEFHHVVLAVNIPGGDATAIIDGFTISGGNANGNGNLSVSGINVNRLYGGGIYSVNSSLVLDNVVITGNHSNYGGGIYSINSLLEFNKVNITGNTSGVFGGGIYIENSSVTINNGEIENNHSNVSGGGVYINGTSNFIIDNVNITSNNSRNAGGIYIGSANSFDMTNGEISGNINVLYGDVFYQSTETFTLAGDADIDSLTLYASSNRISSVNIADGWTGVVLNLNLAGGGPIESVISLWENEQVLTGEVNSVTIGQFALGEFIVGEADKRDIDPTYEINEDGMLKLKQISPVTVSRNGAAADGYINLATALSNIGSSGEYLVTINENQTLVHWTLSVANANVTLIGAGGIREITHNGTGTQTMFTISNADASLVLDNNITLKGNTVSMTGNLISVTNGTLIMQTGSKINGHNTSNASGAVFINGDNNPSFIMNGGEISANISSNAGTNANGGVTVESNSIMIMRGGEIFDNYQVSNRADVFLSSVSTTARSNRLTMSGNAVINTLKINLNETWNNRFMIGANFEGRVDTLHLRGDRFSVFNTWVITIEKVINWFDNIALISAEQGHLLTIDDLAKISFGNFMTPTTGIIQQISPAFYIDLNTVANSGTFGSHSSQVSPFAIITEQDLYKVGSGTDGWTLKAHYRLENNITLNESNQNNWTRIGFNADGELPFSGTFDGNGYTITGLTINPTTDNQGMFGYLTGNVKNLGLINVNIQGNRTYVGGIAGQSEGNIQNSFVSGSISGRGHVGGIVGDNRFSGSVINCYVTGTITGNYNFVNGDRTGGIVGNNSTNGVIRNCISLVQRVSYLSTQTSFIGRVTGQQQGTLQNNFAWNDMTVIYSADSNPDPKTINPGLNTEDGFSISTAEIKTRSTWEAASPLGAVFRFGDDTGNPWVWEDDYMPRLFNQDIKLPWSEHLTKDRITFDIAINPFASSGFDLNLLETEKIILTKPGGDTQEVTINISNLSSYPVGTIIQWRVDGVEKGTGSSFTLRASDYNYGTRFLTLYAVVNSRPHSHVFEFEVRNVFNDSVISISAGLSHTLAITKDGALYAWGNNSDGQLGINNTNNQNTPVRVGADTDWAIISAGFRHSAAIKKDGTLWTWGANWFSGRDGLGGNTINPEELIPGTKWKMVSASSEFTMAIRSDGSLWAWGIWGGNNFGQFGNGTVGEPSVVPVQIGTEYNWKSVSAGAYHTVALKENGSLWTWGDDTDGKLGINSPTGSSNSSSIPIEIGSARNWILVSAGVGHTIALNEDGEIWTWGRDNWWNTRVPTRLSTPSVDWLTVSAGSSYTMAISTDGSLWTWGENMDGQLGLGDTTNRSTPTRIGQADDWAVVSASSGYTIAVKKNDTMFAWGYNNNGSLGTGAIAGATVTSPAPVTFPDP